MTPDQTGGRLRKPRHARIAAAPLKRVGEISGPGRQQPQGTRAPGPQRGSVGGDPEQVAAFPDDRSTQGSEVDRGRQIFYT